jgi:hypothetical protein
VEQAVEEITDVLSGVNNELEALSDDLRDDPDLYSRVSTARAFLHSAIAQLALLGVEMMPNGRPG